MARALRVPGGQPAYRKGPKRPGGRGTVRIPLTGFSVRPRKPVRSSEKGFGEPDPTRSSFVLRFLT